MPINTNNSWIDKSQISNWLLFQELTDTYAEKISFLLSPLNNLPENEELLVEAERLSEKHWFSMWFLTEEEEEKLLEAKRLSKKHWKEKFPI